MFSPGRGRAKPNGTSPVCAKSGKPECAGPPSKIGGSTNERLQLKIAEDEELRGQHALRFGDDRAVCLVYAAWHAAVVWSTTIRL